MVTMWGGLAAKGEEADRTELLWINQHKGKGKPLCHVTAMRQHHARSAAHAIVCFTCYSMES